MEIIALDALGKLHGWCADAVSEFAPFALTAFRHWGPLKLAVAQVHRGGLESFQMEATT
jgi:hypothetical protein